MIFYFFELFKQYFLSEYIYLILCIVVIHNNLIFLI